MALGRDDSFNARLRFWPAAFRGILEMPVAGVGPSGFVGVFWTHASDDEKVFAIRAHFPEAYDDIVVGNSPIINRG